jgi:hypothetical protein
MGLQVALIQPQIPPNTGNIGPEITWSRHHPHSCGFGGLDHGLGLRSRGTSDAGRERALTDGRTLDDHQ